MGVVGLNDVIFASGVNTMTISASAINTKIEQWTSMGESSIAMQVYVDEFLKLQNIMSCYQQLIFKDVTAVNSIGISINDMDTKMVKLWER